MSQYGLNFKSIAMLKQAGKLDAMFAAFNLLSTQIYRNQSMQAHFFSCVVEDVCLTSMNDAQINDSLACVLAIVENERVAAQSIERLSLQLPGLYSVITKACYPRVYKDDGYSYYDCQAIFRAICDYYVHTSFINFNEFKSLLMTAYNYSKGNEPLDALYLDFVKGVIDIVIDNQMKGYEIKNFMKGLTAMMTHSYQSLSFFSIVGLGSYAPGVEKLIVDATGCSSAAKIQKMSAKDKIVQAQSDAVFELIATCEYHGLIQERM